MAEGTVSSDVKSLWKWIGGSAFLASMCCFPSVVLVMFGLASISSAAALSNDLYWGTNGTVSYTHLTLPTIHRV